jgi:hypothetical protein
MTLPCDPWKKHELSLRQKEVHNQKWTVLTQAVASMATVAAVIVALIVAYQGQQSLKSATQYNLLDWNEPQLG